MGLLAAFWQFLSGLLGEELASRAVDRVVSSARSLRSRFIPSLRVHRRELADALREIPFIYRNVRLDIMTDVVAVQMNLLQAGDHNGATGLDVPTYLNQKKRVTFLGNAGVGKTTFMRRTLVDFVHRPAKSLFDPHQRLVPFYVPLKAVDDSREFPILRYLTHNVAYLRGPGGRARLARLARDGRVFLMLDGYDEIAFANARSFVREELSILFSKPVKIGIKSTYPRNLLDNLRTNRIWLTSRPDFFHEHIPDLVRTRDTGLDMLGTSVLILHVEGLGPNRGELVKRIFARHDQQNTGLDADKFLDYIDGTGTRRCRRCRTTLCS
jgi:hypothetical protein